jgi:Uncharacterized conserved protein, contains double-stranded beta-helix domain
VAEARLEDLGSGLTPVTEGWFVVNVSDAEWWYADSRGGMCGFENEYGRSPVEFEQLGIRVTVLEPGQTSLYHAEQNQEAFLVLSGECRLIVEGEERRLRRWDFFHSPPWTEHGFVGAGDAPCVILMAGARSGPGVRYPGVGGSGPLRRVRGRGNLRLEAGLRERRDVPARAPAELVSPALGIAHLRVTLVRAFAYSFRARGL